MLVHPELWSDMRCNFSLGCVIYDFVFFFFQLWCSNTFHISSPLTPHFPIHFSSYSCCRENRLCVELVKSLSKSCFMKLYLFVAWIICICVNALVKTILPHEEMTQVANSYCFWRCASSSLECSHVCALIYFIWGRILRELNTCSWIAYIATINSDLCMSSFIMYL